MYDPFCSCASLLVLKGQGPFNLLWCSLLHHLGRETKARGCSLLKKMPRAPVSSLLKLILGGFGLVLQEDVPRDAVHRVAAGEVHSQSLPRRLQQGEKDFGARLCGCKGSEDVTACSCPVREQRKGAHLFKRRGCKIYCVSWSVEWEFN